MAPSRPAILELALLLGLIGCDRATWEADVRQEAPIAVSAAPKPSTIVPAQESPHASPKPRGSLVRRLKKITRGRYMEGRCRKTTHPGWDGFPLKSCSYAVPDATGHKTTRAVMLNPSAKKLARWIRSACDNQPEGCDDRLLERILYQSSAQFVVAGIVLEDIRPTDRHFEMYCFRDGVRVEVAGFETKSTARPTDAHFDACLTGELVSPTSFARIAGTTPSQYRAAGGREDVGVDGAPTAAWLDVTRAAYQAAWRSPRNALIDAWVRGRPRD